MACHVPANVYRDTRSVNYIIIINSDHNRNNNNIYIYVFSQHPYCCINNLF